MTAVYDFREQLEKSEAPSLEDGWLAAYRTQFPDSKSVVKMADSLYVQQFGFDRVVVDHTGRTWNVEEKVDFYDNDRIALEYVSNTTTNKPGWVVKPSQADFIAYRKEKLGQIWFWSAPAVRRAWQLHGTQLIELAKARSLGFVHGEAKNPGYSSLIACVPIGMWERALRSSSEVKFT